MKDKDPIQYVIRVSENVLIQMCLNGLESYSVRHREGRAKDGKLNKGRTRLETLGLLWGHYVKIADQNIYCVEMMSIDTSAVRDRGSVDPDYDALVLKRDLMTSFWPQYEFLGDFHTHPYDHYSEVGPEERSFSNSDICSIEDESEYWIKHNYRVGLVMTIARLQKKVGREADWIDGNNSTIKFDLGNYRLWLKGYVALRDGEKIRFNMDDNKILLDCPSLVGLVGEYVEFGRVEKGKNNQTKHKPGNLDAS